MLKNMGPSSKSLSEMLNLAIEHRVSCPLGVKDDINLMHRTIGIKCSCGFLCYVKLTTLRRENLIDYLVVDPWTRQATISAINQGATLSDLEKLATVNEITTC